MYKIKLETLQAMVKHLKKVEKLLLELEQSDEYVAMDPNNAKNVFKENERILDHLKIEYYL